MDQPLLCKHSVPPPASAELHLDIQSPRFQVRPRRWRRVASTNGGDRRWRIAEDGGCFDGGYIGLAVEVDYLSEQWDESYHRVSHAKETQSGPPFF